MNGTIILIRSKKRKEVRKKQEHHFMALKSRRECYRLLVQQLVLYSSFLRTTSGLLVVVYIGSDSSGFFLITVFRALSLCVLYTLIQFYSTVYLLREQRDRSGPSIDAVSIRESSEVRQVVTARSQKRVRPSAVAFAPLTFSVLSVPVSAESRRRQVSTPRSQTLFARTFLTHGGSLCRYATTRLRRDMRPHH